MLRKLLILLLILQILPISVFASDEAVKELDVDKYKALAYLYPIPKITPPKGEHPRLYLTKKDIPVIRENQNTDEHKPYYEKLMQFGSLDFDGNLPQAPAGTSNANTNVLRKVEAYTYRYLINNEKEYGPKAIEIMKNYLNTVDHLTAVNNYRIIGETINVAALVYDWCYDIMDIPTKQLFIDRIMQFLPLMDIGYPPKEGSMITSHSSEAQLMRDQLSAAVALYDEVPDIYNNVAGLFFTEFVEARNFFYESNMTLQGDFYGYYRYRWDLYAALIFERMGYPNIFSDEQTKVPYRYIYSRRPDGQIFRAGDSSFGAQQRLGSYWTFIFETSMAASMAKDPYLKSELLRQTIHTSVTLPFWMLVFNDPNIEPKPISALPLTRYFPEPMGEMTARTGWDLGLESNTVVADMKIMTSKVNNHQHQDSGTFQIYYKGGLAIESGMYEGKYGAYASEHDLNFHKRTIAHNGLLIYDPNEQFLNGSIPLSNDGGQKLYNNFKEYLTFKQFKDDNADNVGKVLAYEYGPSLETPYYSYIKGDITNAYSDKVSDVKRSFMFLNTGDSEIPGIMFVYDKITSTNPNFKKTWLMHSVEEPEINENITTIKRTEHGYSGKLVNTTLLPDAGNLNSNIVKGFVVDGVEYPQVPNSENVADALDGGKYRVEISPNKPNLTDTFLNVIQVMDGETKESEVIKLDSNKFIGAKIKNNAVLFSKSGEKLGGTLNFSVNEDSEEEVRFVITDLKEGYYHVQREGDPYTPYQYKVSKDGGVLHFSGKPGNYTIVQYDSISMLSLPPSKATVIDRQEVSNIDVMINSQYVPASPDLIEDILTLPMRMVFQNFGYSVNYNSEDEKTVVENEVNKLVFGKDNMVEINGEMHQLEIAPYYKGNTQMIPIEKLSELLFFDFEYLPTNNTIKLNHHSLKQDMSDDRAVKIYRVKSSSDSGNVIENVLDGDPVTFWGSEGLGEYAIFDLREPQNISEVGIMWLNAAGRTNKFEIYVSDDNVNYSKIYSGSSKGIVGFEYFEFPTVKTRYLKYVGYGYENSVWNVISEFVIRKAK